MSDDKNLEKSPVRELIGAVVPAILWLVVIVSVIQAVIMLIRFGPTATPTLLSDLQPPVWAIAAMLSERKGW